MWDYIKVNVPIVAKVSACAALRFLTMVGAVAASIAIHAGFTSLTHSPVIGLLATLPAAFAITALATVISNAVIHAMGWDAYRTTVMGPMTFFMVQL